MLMMSANMRNIFCVSTYLFPNSTVDKIPYEC